MNLYNFLTFLEHGLLNLPIWGYIVVTLVFMHLTLICVTLYLHRCQAHRAIDLHPLPSHLCRFWLWLTTGMRTIEWVAIHRKHHAFSDRTGDPHSPVVFGLGKVFWEGTELYRDESENLETMQRYGHATPKDWLEKNIYYPHNYVGIAIMFAIDFVLFGTPGITIWALQMLCIPISAAGIINGIGHAWGYRNFECNDAARNIIPWAIFIMGEELHNNHHTYPTSAKLSVKWYEFDMGWFYINLLSKLKLAHVKKTPPKPHLVKDKFSIDLNTIKAVFANRFQVMANYKNKVILPMLKAEKQLLIKQNQRLSILKRARKLLTRNNKLFDTQHLLSLRTLLAERENLNLVYQYRMKLQGIWEKTSATQKELVEALQEWCKQAEATGVKTLEDFALYLRRYSLKTV